MTKERRMHERADDVEDVRHERRQRQAATQTQKTKNQAGAQAFHWTHKLLSASLYNNLMQWKRAGLVTLKSLDRNQALLYIVTDSFFTLLVPGPNSFDASRDPDPLKSGLELLPQDLAHTIPRSLAPMRIRES